MISEKQFLKIRDLGRVITGKTPPTAHAEFFGEDFPFITPTDIKSFDVRYFSQTERLLSMKGCEYQKRYLLPRNAVCYVCIGSTIGKMCFVERESFTNQQINSIIVDEQRFDPIYVFYLLRTITPKIQAISGGSGAGKAILNKTSFEDIDVEVHSRQIQRKIAAILSAYDDLIENNTRRIKILEEMAQMIYREWFVNFRFPGHEKVKMVDSPLGKIPEGWEVKPLKDICELVNYGYTTSAKPKVVGPKFLRITDIVPYLIDWDSVPYCEIAEKNLPKYKLDDGDIVIARTGATTGYAKRINKRHPESVFASYLVRIRICNELSNHYIGLIVESDDYKRFIKTNLGGAAQPQANAQVLTSLPVLIPPRTLQDSFDQIVEDILDQRELLQAKNLNLRRTRDLLLPKLISGEVEVEEIEPIVGENMK